MKQLHKISSLLGIFVIVGMVFLAIHSEAQFDITTVEDSAFADRERMKPVVSFYHDEHNEAAGIYDCSVCHHMYDDGEKMEGADSIGMECSACHMAEPDQTEMDLIRAYHLQCRTCHMEEKAGPILCGECHTGEK